MATIATARGTQVRGEPFFLWSAIAMALVIVAGFSLQLAMGRSSFAASPPLVHAHAIVFMGWVAIYVTQNVLVASGSIALHRRLGWVAAGWIVAMCVLGCAVTLAMVREGRTPFFFTPLQFLILDPVSVFSFAGLSAAAIVLRRQTDWHRRLHFCGMAILMGPAYGRLLPLPLLIPWAYEATFAAVMIFPVVGVIADWRRTGRVHPAWGWGIGVIVLGTLVFVQLLSHSATGVSIYEAVTAGTPGAAIAPLAFPPFPRHP
ncbi:hypothetical protein AB5I39_16200 [Sphingomonas sp. MMS24-J45]|uniref:hypothetical protein n=1 Tax=Sphingomonas sp. MMS24-J45 TaxID=3238806 RepID=UPI00384BDFFB